MYDKLLVAIDDSEPASHALEQAGDLATLSKGSVEVVHVREHIIVRGADWYVTEEDDARELVDRAAARLRDRGVAASGVVLHGAQGHMADVICDQAETSGADLVVVGSHGRTDLGGILLGNVAHRVIHLARGPVLVVR